MITIFFPNIIFALYVENKRINSKRLSIMFELYVDLKKALLERDFPSTFVRGFKAWKKRN